MKLYHGCNHSEGHAYCSGQLTNQSGSHPQDSAGDVFLIVGRPLAFHEEQGTAAVGHSGRLQSTMHLNVVHWQT